jgi:hypothetical protein
MRNQGEQEKERGNVWNPSTDTVKILYRSEDGRRILGVFTSTPPTSVIPLRHNRTAL